jgi:hypothetical protein
MNQWLNRSHPPTLQAAVFLGYLSAVFGLLFQAGQLIPVPAILLILLYLGVGAGAFVTANNRRWGFLLLATCAGLIAVFDVADVATSLLRSYPLELILSFMNRAVFPVALAAAVLHPQSREYQRVWFE